MATKAMNIRMTHTKQALIQSFIEIVAKKDFEKVTIADIAKGAQVNRATFYAHFQDKYELLDYMIGDSVSAAIVNRTEGELKFDQDSISKLVLALCDFYQPPNFPCRSSYVGLVVPQLREKALHELQVYLSQSFGAIDTEEGKKTIFVPIFAQVIQESAWQWASGKTMLSKEEVADKVARFVVDGYQASERAL